MIEIRKAQVVGRQSVEGRDRLSRWLYANALDHNDLDVLRKALHGAASAAGAFKKPIQNVFPQEVSLAAAYRQAWLKLLAQFDGATGFVVRGDTLTIQDDGALRYLAGCWLEEAVKQRLVELLPPDAKVETGIKLSLPGSAMEMRDLDVAVLFADQLHVIECKTGIYAGKNEGDGVNQDTLNKLTDIKSRLAGPRSTVALANPRDPSTNAFFSDLEQRAKAARIRFWTGHEMRSSLEGFARGLGK